MTSASLYNGLGNLIVKNNQIHVTFTYTLSPATVIPSNLKVTIQTPVNCTFYNPADGTTVTELPLTLSQDQKTGTAIFLMDTTDQNPSFTAAVNDTYNTQKPYSGTAVGYSISSIDLNLSATYLPTWDGTGQAPFLTAKCVAKDDSPYPGHQLQGQDVYIWATGPDGDEDLFLNYVDVSLTAGGPILTESQYDTIKFNRKTFKAVRRTTPAFGIAQIWLQPHPNVQGATVVLHSRLGNQFNALETQAITIVNPTPNGPSLNDPSEPPKVYYLDEAGEYMDPPTGATECLVSFPKASSMSIEGYAVTNQDSNGNRVFVMSQLADDVAYEDPGQTRVLMKFPMGLLTVCQNQGNCMDSDLNALGYAYFEQGSGNSSYSEYTDFWLDTPVQNVPPPAKRSYDVPLLYQGQLNPSNKLTIHGYQIPPDQPDNPLAWVNQKAISMGGIIINIPSTSLKGKMVQGAIRLNGLYPNATHTTPATDHITTIPLLQTAQQVPNTGGLDIPIYAKDLVNYDLGPASIAPGFYVEYWEDGIESVRSVIYWCPLNTVPPY